MRMGLNIASNDLQLDAVRGLGIRVIMLDFLRLIIRGLQNVRIRLRDERILLLRFRLWLRLVRRFRI